MRKIAAIILIVVLLNLLVGCKGRGDDQIPTPASSVTELTRPMQPETYATFGVEEMKDFVDTKFTGYGPFGVIYFDEEEAIRKYGLSDPVDMGYALYCDWETCVGSDSVYYQEGFFYVRAREVLDDVLAGNPDIGTWYTLGAGISYEIDEITGAIDISRLRAEDFERQVLEMNLDDDSFSLEVAYSIDQLKIILNLRGDTSKPEDCLIYSDKLFADFLPLFKMYRVE